MVDPKVTRILNRLERVQWIHENAWRSACPAHSDNDPSLALSVVNGRILVCCHGGCPAEKIIEKLGLTWKDFKLDDAKIGEVKKSFASSLDTLKSRVYSAVIRELTLNEEHYHNLVERGLSHETITRNAYRSLTFIGGINALRDLQSTFSRDQLLTIPGVVAEGQYLRLTQSSGLLIPVRDPWGLIVGCQIRMTKRDRKYRWLSTPGASSSGTPSHCPLRVTGATLTDDASPRVAIRITEGPLKADITAEHDPKMITVGVPGVRSWRSVIPFLEALNPPKVHLAIDADWPQKPEVFEALRQMADYLTDRECPTFLEWWDVKDGKGIDDLLVAGGKPRVINVEDLLS